MKTKIVNTVYSLTLLLFIIAFNLQHNPPGWYQQQLPVNDLINDIFFLDSLTGWAVTDGRINPPDTGYIFKTIDGGETWITQRSQNDRFGGVQFLDENTGYVILGWNTARIIKTTDGGSNWIETANFGIGFGLTSIFFINADTGWACSSDFDFGGIWKTTNGGGSWQQQLPASARIRRMHFLNADTGWAVSVHTQGRLYRTINGGTNWDLQYTFSSGLGDVYFFNNLVGIVTAGVNHRTTDGGFTWTETNESGIKISMGSDSVGWAGTNAVQRIRITTDGGKSWGNQQISLTGTKIPNAVNDLIAWAGGGNGIVHTTDGGGPVLNIQQISTEIPDGFVLYQNYPNPFNPNTIINYQLTMFSRVRLVVFDITGKEIAELVKADQPAGTYRYSFDASGLTSGVYFYRLEAETRTGERFSRTKKMLFVR